MCCLKFNVSKLIVMFVDDFPGLVVLWKACYEKMDKLKDELVIQHYIINIIKYQRQHKKNACQVLNAINLLFF